MGAGSGDRRRPNHALLRQYFPELPGRGTVKARADTWCRISQRDLKAQLPDPQHDILIGGYRESLACGGTDICGALLRLGLGRKEEC